MSEYPRVTAVQFSAAPRRDIRTGLLGFASFDLGGVRIEGVAVRRTRDGRLALSFPRRTDRHGVQHDVVRPVDDASRRAIEEEIFDALTPYRDEARP